MVDKVPLLLPHLVVGLLAYRSRMASDVSATLFARRHSSIGNPVLSMYYEFGISSF